MNKKRFQNLQKSKITKNNEFYTFFDDIEKELKDYQKFLKNKIIYLNCDNPKIRNFWKYFNENFENLKLKKVYASFLSDEKNSFLYEKNNKGIFKSNLISNGDFRSIPCIDILKKSNIIITNPPYSLSYDFYDILIKYNKDYLIVQSLTSLCKLNVIKEFKKNKCFTGKNLIRKFYNENNEVKEVPSIWLTNLNSNKKNIKILNKKFSDVNKKYEDKTNFLIIDKIKDIPQDYFKPFLVPITFLLHKTEEEYIILQTIRPFSENILGFIRIIIVRKYKNDGSVNYKTETEKEKEKELTLF